ncbi:ABC transporter permease [Devosia psychrophila]|jgi:peptide/nickel transport system permease protein|uniref:ABC transporter permease n=1 Tax=Devosia psychrophila TaxID=728005 RepID=A0A0F5PXV9_9HYPH|nr:ABC transporter permease [Devosia psychrophila]KKC33488.1 ABC transporter permease [Devosia psychrophila]SFD15250.1 peptide/nickel transport system permease protein [Devosia psychrophila]
MWTFIIRRLLQSAIVIIGVTLITFTALQMSGDPTYLYVSERATEEEIQRTREALGFDKPLPEQYLTFLGKLAQGDFGNSLSYKRPAIEAVMDALPATLELTFFAMILAIVVAIPLGVIASLNRGSAADGSVMTMAMLGQSIPSFWLGIMMIMFFGLQLRILPISGHVPFIMPLIQGNFMQALTNLPQSLYYLIMPGFAVAFYSISRNARLVRSSMLEVLGQDFVRTARAKGISESAVVIHHALRNAWLPVVTMIGLEFGFLIGGVVVVEIVFSWPGLGRLVFNAINQRDIPVVQAAVVTLAMVFIALNLIVDLVYAKIDPRVKL